MRLVCGCGGASPLANFSAQFRQTTQSSVLALLASCRLRLFFAKPIKVHDRVVLSSLDRHSLASGDIDIIH
jgi:hypothetical protein